MTDFYKLSELARVALQKQESLGKLPILKHYLERYIESLNKLEDYLNKDMTFTTQTGRVHTRLMNQREAIRETLLFYSEKPVSNFPTYLSDFLFEIGNFSSWNHRQLLKMQCNEEPNLLGL